MDARKKKNLEETYERILNVGFCIVPYEDLSDIIGPDPMVYGTAKDERILSFEGVEALFKSQHEQMGTMKPAYDRKRIALRISNGGNNACIIEEITFTLSSDEEIHTIFMRATCVMEYLDNQWKLTHWHTSTPVDTENDPWHMEEWKREKEKLQNLVDQQTADLQNKNKELEIEAALERVRSRSLAMHKSDELNEVVSVLFEKLKGLQIPFTAVGIATGIEGSKDLNVFVCGENEAGLVISNYRLPYFDNPISNDLYSALEKQLDFFVGHYSKEEKNSFYEYVIENTAEFKHLPEDIKQMIFESPTYTISTVAVKNAVFSINDFEGKVLADHEVDILKRFARVFDQAYTRFLDLQKAEAQTREARIEAALERVRSRLMAMHKSEELKDVVKEIFDQLANLSINAEHAGIVVDYEAKKDWHFWVAETQDIPAKVTVPYLDQVWDRQFTEAKREGKPFFTTQLNFEEKNSFYKILLPHIEGLNKEASDFYFSCPGLAISTTIEEDIGLYIENFSGTPYSGEENEILKRFGKVFQQAYTRFLDLQKAEAQAREAQIVASMERVRAATMAMHQSDELSLVLSKLFEQFDVLGIKPSHAVLTLIDKEKNTMNFRTTGKNGYQVLGEQEVDLSVMNAWVDTAEKWKKSDPNAVNVNEYPPEILPEVWEVYKDILATMPQKARPEIKDFPDGLFITEGYCRFGYIGFAHHRKPSEEEKDIVRRIAAEFGTLYQRFLDLQKAEAQAREAQIEAALERVRSRSMAMQKSEEIKDVVVTVLQKINELNIEMNGGVSLATFIEGSQDLLHWYVNPDLVEDPVAMYLPYFEDKVFDDFVEARRSGKEILSVVYSFEEKNAYLKYAFQHSDFSIVPEESKSWVLEQPYFGYSVTIQKHSAIFFNDYTGKLFSEKENEVLVRFAKVFDQAYTRFLDLQRAEAQAREAKIEAALEKVRSRTMGMQSSEELPEVANLLFLEIQALGIPAWSCGYCILEEDRRSSTCIMSSEGTIQKPFLLPHSGEPSFEEWDDFVHGDQTFFTQELKGEPIESHYNFMKSLPQLKPVFQDLVDAGLSLPAYQINHLCKFSHGFLLFITYEEVPGSHDIFKRFTSVFDQTYTRFLDLKKSEQRAREAEVDLSLERVRSQVTAMQTSSDLFDIVVNMRKEFVSLGHAADYFWHMSWLPDSYEMSMTSEDGNRIGMVISLPRFVHEQIPGLIEWEKGNEAVYVMALDADEAWDYIENMNTHGRYEQADPHAPTRNDIESIGGLTFIIARTSHGEIGFSLPGEVPHPPQEALDTLVRFAGVFDLAYQRFEDLQESEQQARLILEERDRLEAALKELHATQDQLVQQEKLASLGQLTAGIAHEIKNPLNFVNNFSEVSVELVEEAKEELSAFSDQLSAGDADKVKEALEILDDIGANLKKIHEHGSRADGIVKSMLMHSRGGDGKMEPTDINELVKEYVNLSYHGMRAGKNPIDVDIDLQLDEAIGEVPLIAEDFSRVILNLCTNAFDACAQRGSSENLPQSPGGSFESLPQSGSPRRVPPPYKPSLAIRTGKTNGTITIEIEDNGPGIPDDIKDKIMQPFFTTKKGTQGTGLGLSITNDIIKAHGGMLHISSSHDGSTFKIMINS